jgi:hypothetical protein
MGHTGAFDNGAVRMIDRDHPLFLIAEGADAHLRKSPTWDQGTEVFAELMLQETVIPPA